METNYRIRELRARLGWSQEKMAGYLGVTDSRICQLEKNPDTRPSGPLTKMIERREIAANQTP